MACFQEHVASSVFCPSFQSRLPLLLQSEIFFSCLCSVLRHLLLPTPTPLHCCRRYSSAQEWHPRDGVEASMGCSQGPSALPVPCEISSLTIRQGVMTSVNDKEGSDSCEARSMVARPSIPEPPPFPISARLLNVWPCVTHTARYTFGNLFVLETRGQ